MACSMLARCSEEPGARTIALRVALTSSVPWWKKSTTHAATLVVLGFILTVVLAILGVQGKATEWPTFVLLTVLAGVFQVAGASKFHSAGRADPSLARASVRRLIALAARAHNSRIAAEASYEQGTPNESKKQMGVMSAELSFIEEGLIHAIEDWREFHGDALSGLEEVSGGNGSN